MEQDNLFKEYRGVFNQEETVGQKEKKERIFGYSPFALQDAIGERSAKKAWIEYEKLRFTGIVADDLIHNIISKIRDMSAIIMGAKKEDLNMKDYPYNKSKRDLKNWKKEDLRNLHTKIVEIYYKSRMGDDDIDTATEKTLLGI